MQWIVNPVTSALGRGGLDVAEECGVDSRDDAFILVDHDIACVQVGRIPYKLLLSLLRQPERLGDLVFGWQAEVLLAKVIVAGRILVAPLWEGKS